MSLVSTYVCIGKDKFLQDPVIRFEHGFICFDDDDPPEIVLRESSFASNVIASNYAVGLLGRLSIPFSDRDRSGSKLWKMKHQGARCFERKLLVFHDAISTWFRLKGPIPIDEKWGPGVGSKVEFTRLGGAPGVPIRHVPTFIVNYKVNGVKVRVEYDKVVKRADIWQGCIEGVD